MKNILLTIGSIGIIIGVMYASVLQAAPTTQYFVNLAPFTTNTYTNGDSSHYWSATYTKDLFFSTTTAGCATIAPTGQTYSTGSSCATLPTFSPNSIITSNGSGNLIATGTQLTVGNIVATTTNASSFVGNVGIATTSPFISGLTIASGTVFLPELSLATSSTIQLGVASSTQQLVRFGSSAITINISTYLAAPGTKTTIVTCGPLTGTGGAITFTGLRFSGGTQPGNTTTANQCDMWFVVVTQATSSTIAVLTGILPGIQ